MAEVVTATTGEGKVSLWETVPRPEFSAIPRGEITFQGNELIPAKAAVDQSMWTLQCNFPRNWVFRLVEYRIWVLSEATDVDWDTAMSCLVSSDAADEDDWFFGIYATKALIGTSPYVNFQFVPADPTFISFYAPLGPIDAAINSGEGSARLFQRWVDFTSDTTVAMNAFFRIRALMYDVDQARLWPMHSPVPTIGP